MVKITDYFRKDENAIPIPVDKELVRGKILRLSDEGWGFIISKDVPFEKIFFHWTALEQDTLRFPKLEEGMEVEFIPIEQSDERGFRAIKVRVIEDHES